MYLNEKAKRKICSQIDVSLQDIDKIIDQLVKYEKLPEKYLEILKLVYEDDVKIKTISEDLNVSYTRVREIINVALKRIKSTKIVDDNSEEYYLVKNIPMMSTRLSNCLIRGGIKNLKDLENKQRNDILQIRNMGRSSFSELITICDKYGIKIE